MRGDEALVELAVQNLFDNARKFAESGPVKAVIERAAGRFDLVVTTPGARIPARTARRSSTASVAAPKRAPRPTGTAWAWPSRDTPLAFTAATSVASRPRTEDARFVLEIPVWSPAAPRAGS